MIGLNLEKHTVGRTPGTRKDRGPVRRSKKREGEELKVKRGGEWPT